MPHVRLCCIDRQVTQSGGTPESESCFSWNLDSDFTVAGAKALTILAEGGTTKVVP